MATPVETNRYSDAIDVQIDIAAFYDSPRGRQVIDGWENMYIRAVRRDNPAYHPNTHRWDAAHEYLRMSPVYLSARIVHMLEDAAHTFPDDYALHPEDILIPRGFLLIEGKGWDITPHGTPMGYKQHMKVLAWSSGSEGVVVHAIGTSTAEPERIAYLEQHAEQVDPITDRHGRQVLQDELYALSQGALNQLLLVETWDWGDRIGELSSAQQAVQVAFEDARERGGVSEEWVVGAPESIGERAMITRRVAYAIWSFMRQKITTTTAHGVDRATRRRVTPILGHEPVIQVIELRAHASDRLSTVEEAERSPYSVRFIVRGHWRNQWYPSEDRHKPKWIEPYVKGPDGAPVRGGSKLFAVVR